MPRSILAVPAALLLVACATGDGRELKAPTEPLPPETTTTTTTTVAPFVPAATDVAATLPAEPTTSVGAESEIEIERLDSPANATAEMAGFGANVSHPVTVDGEAGDVLSFDVLADGSFVMQVWIEDEGAHTVCVADACGRVYTRAPDAETPEEVVAKIEEAIPLAMGYIDLTTEFPDWTIDIGGALSGTGGTTDVDSKTITIYRNRGRTVDDFVRTVLHEMGHVVDFERMDDDRRVDYITIRGGDPATPWRSGEQHRLDSWAAQPSEDFAEVMVAIWTEGRWEPRTPDFAPPPDPDQLALIEALVAG